MLEPEKPKDQWSERDWQLIALLSRGQSKTAAAEAAGCSRGTVSHLWNDNIEFRKAVRKLTEDRLQRDERLLAESLREAVEKLRELMGSDDENVSLRACALIVNRCESIADSHVQNSLDELQAWRQEVAAEGAP